MDIGSEKRSEQLMPAARITRREWQWVAIFTLVLLIVTTLPYVLGWLVQGSEWVFNGFVFGVEDGNSYLGKIRLGVRGEWAFHLFMTPENHAGAPLLYLPYIAAGHILGLFIEEDDPAILTGLIITYHAMRLLLIPPLIIVTYWLIAIFLPSAASRFLALVIVFLGQGLGWLLALLGQRDWLGTLPPGFYIPEAFSTLIVLGLPHIILGRLALLGGFLALFRAMCLTGWRRWGPWVTFAGACWLGVGLSVAFYLALIYVLLAVWGLALWFRWRSLPWSFALRGGSAAAITLPLFGYYAWIFSQDETFATLSEQIYVPSPHPLQYLLAYGILGILAARGGWWAWKKHCRDPRYVLLVAWILVVPFLVYIPVNVQRRLLESVIVPLAILAVMGLRLLTVPLARSLGLSYRRISRRLVMAVLPLLVTSSLFILLGVYLGVINPQRPVFRPQAEVTAMEWLAARAPKDAVVMGSMETGNFLPVVTDLRPFLGHGPETLHSDEKGQTVEDFFSQRLSFDEQVSLYSTFDIQYVFYGPLEREFANTDQMPAWAATLTLIYDQNGYQIYEVQP
ncbi:MAG: hypothetical protein GYB66_08715 [Chloroflexi bacterium]|nr:hypothetical protein [Chloroflexota bacterium]